MAAVIGGVLSLCAIFIALFQLNQIRCQLRDSNLSNMLSLESEINVRKGRLDELNREIEKLNVSGKLDMRLREIEKRYHETALEDWLNSVDRLCYCILKGYFAERDWRTEYREYISNAVRAFPDKFNQGSIYTNIIDLNNKWQRT